jgi:hypothetical protein
MFSVYGVKLLSLKTIPPWWQTFRWRHRGWNAGAEVAETTVIRLLCCGFRRTGKAAEQVYQCWWRICREINVFRGSNIMCFTFYINLWPVCWLSLVSYVTTLSVAENTQRQCYDNQWMMNQKGFGRKPQWPNLRYHFGIKYCKYQ